MIYVYTVTLNGWDNLQPPAAVTSEARYVCFTNIPQLRAVSPWETRPVYEIGEACRTARLPKILPHLFLPDDAEYSIYHDGNLRLSKGPEAIVSEVLQGHDWAAHRHPCRRCIYDEAAILLKENIGTGELVRAEVARYREMGYPESNGLWANGLLIRRHSPQAIRTCEAWWKLYAAGCERDQLSFPVARRAENLAVRTIDANIYESPYAGFHFHAAWKDRRPNPEFHGERAGIRAQLQRLAQVAGPGAGVRYPEY